MRPAGKWHAFYPVWTAFCDEYAYRSISSSSFRRNNQLSKLIASMSINKDAVAQNLRTNRVKKQQKNNKWRSATPGTIHLKVLGNGSPGAPHALYVFTDQQRYLFNCGEGTQRLAQEYKVKLSKFEHVFITHSSWSNIGGLLGLTLTVKDIGIPQIGLHGPPGVEKLFEMTKGFANIRGLEINKHDYKEHFFVDSAFTIEYVPLLGPKRQFVANSDMSCEEHVDYYEDERSGGSSRRSPTPSSDSGSRPSSRGSSKSANGKQSPQRQQSPQHHSPQGKRSASPESPRMTKRQKLVNEVREERDISVAYICKAHDKPGHLLLEKCVEKGVKPGPCLGELKNGKDVVLDDGRVVLSKDVTSPDELGPTFIVIDCPTVEFLDSLLASEPLRVRQEQGTHEEDIVEVVVHFTPDIVMKHDKYKLWMQRFSPSTYHLLLNDSCSGPASNAVHRIQHKLNLIHSHIFPLLEDCMHNAVDTAEDIPLVVRGESMMQYDLRPRKKINRESISLDGPEDFVKEAQEMPDFSNILTDLRLQLQSTIADYEEEFPQFVFLGTGSAVPAKDRNVSSILIHTSPNCSMLLDCGEGTLNQLIRFYGLSKGTAVLQKLKAIFISHLHADHHLGLLEVLAWRRRSFNPTTPLTKLDLIAPQQIEPWLVAYNNHFSAISEDFRIVPNTMLLDRTKQLENYSAVLERLNFKDISTVYAIHCRHAFGVVLTHQDGWKVAYSGDTMPCEDLIKAGQHCDLLIHEATMEDDLFEMARAKTHSTTSQAIEVGKAMKAKFTMLTHFSQRYAKVPVVNSNFSQNVGIAFDNMKVSLGDLSKLPLFVPALKALFAEHYEEMQEKTAKQKNRLNSQS